MDLVVPLAARVAKLQALPSEARDATARGADVDVPQAVRDAADAALARGETHYTDRPGILPLREQVARDVQARFGVEVDAKGGVVITCGGTEARFVAVQQLLPTGGTLIALSHPERLAAACIVRDVTLATADDGATDDATGVALYLNGETPHDVADAWLARAKTQGWPVMYEADAGGRHPATLGLAEQTITIGSLGLDQGMASWRLGFLAAPVAKAGPLREFKLALTLCSTNVSQWGALGLDQGDAA